MLLFWPKRLRNLTSDTLRLTGRAAEILSAVECSVTPSSMTFHLIFLYYLMLTKRSFGVNIVAVVLPFAHRTSPNLRNWWHRVTLEAKLMSEYRII